MTAPTPSPIAVAFPGDAACQSLFPAELPVSYDATGNVASRFGDLVWNLVSMSTDGTSAKNLHFYQADSSTDPSLGWQLREQHKALIWLHMDAGKTRSWATLNPATLALKFCCKKAAEKRVDLFSLLTNPDWIREAVSGMNTLYARMTAASLKTLWRHRNELKAPTDFPYQKILSAINKDAQSRPETQQTPIIPSRIYCAILTALGERLSVIEHELEALLDAYDKDHETWLNAPKDATSNEQYEIRAATMAGTAESMMELGYKPEKSRPLDNFIAGRINSHKLALMLTIAAYTGMRVGEVSILPLEDVLASFEHMGSIHYELKSSTHKLNNGVKVSTTWITSDQGARAVQLAQRIARNVQKHHVISPRPGQQALLFPSNLSVFKTIGKADFFRTITKLRVDICPVIEQSDIEELDRLELARGWSDDDIVVGTRWPLAFHQLRRSLAVYAHRSGMVSLPALKAQLQHITQEMTSYYADGFSRAVNLVFDKTHFSHEWEAAKAESSYFAYSFGVLFSDEDLFGQGVQRMANTVDSRNRQDTLHLFEENKLAYRETPLGGCVSTEDCKTDPLEPIPYDCLETNCVNLVVFGKRLEHIINHQEVAVATLEKDEAGSVEHRLEASHLKLLLKAREHLHRREQ